MRSRRVFIGSSTPALDVARVVASVLGGQGFECTLWPDAFPPGAYTFDALLRAAASHGFGIFVAQADDLVSTDGRSFTAARPNVVGEFFLFAGRNGLARTFLLVPHDARPELPTDLSGIVWTGFSAARFATEPSSAIHEPCLTLVRQMLRITGEDAAAEREAVSRALNKTNAILVMELFRASVVLRDVIDAVQRDTLAKLLDETTFAQVKSAATDRIIALSKASSERAETVGVAKEFASLRDALVHAVRALPYPHDVTQGFADIQKLAQRSTFAAIPALAEAVQRRDFVTALALIARLKESLTPEEVAEASLEILTARLKRLQDTYANWWNACSRRVNRALDEFQFALVKAQTEIALAEHEPARLSVFT